MLRSARSRFSPTLPPSHRPPFWRGDQEAPAGHPVGFSEEDPTGSGAGPTQMSGSLPRRPGPRAIAPYLQFASDQRERNTGLAPGALRHSLAVGISSHSSSRTSRPHADMEFDGRLLRSTWTGRQPSPAAPSPFLCLLAPFLPCKTAYISPAIPDETMLGMTAASNPAVSVTGEVVFVEDGAMREDGTRLGALRCNLHRFGDLWNEQPLLSVFQPPPPALPPGFTQ